MGRIRQIMERQLGHLVHLVDDLLDVARISTGKIELKKARVRLEDVVLSAAETARPGIEAKRQNLRIDIADAAIVLDADPIRLAQVIGNLLTNARKYTPEHGRIDLSVRREAQEAVVVVRDDGIGIPPDALPHVFDLFSQVGQGIEHAQGGLGIGLSLVKRLTEKHGGRVGAFSAGPGHGAAFTVRLPVAAPLPQVAGARAAHDRPPPARGATAPLRVLIADDNQDAAALLKEVLEAQGHTVAVAHDGRTALTLASAFVPDVALLDIGMPVMNGYELAHAIARVPALQATRLAAVTGWGAKEDRARTRAAGFHHHLTKPVSLASLQTVLASAGAGAAARAV
jgi:CheY-like chemotaxis protein